VEDLARLERNCRELFGTLEGALDSVGPVELRLPALAAEEAHPAVAAEKLAEDVLFGKARDQRVDRPVQRPSELDRVARSDHEPVWQSVVKVQMAALRAPRAQMLGAGPQAMAVYIVEGRQRRRCARAAATRRAHGSCGRSLRCSSSTMRTDIAFLLAPCARLTIPMRATVCTFTTGC